MAAAVQNAKSILDFNETLYKELRKTLGSKEASGDKVGSTFLPLVRTPCLHLHQPKNSL
jgi:hypothetical protein